MSDIPSKLEPTKPASSVEFSPESERMEFTDIQRCMDKFFEDRDYKLNLAYKKGFASVISEDYTKIDLVCNLVDILYNLCGDESTMSPEEKKNFKQLTTGINMLNRSLKQYDKKTTGEFVAVISGYILKLIRNNLHD